MTDKKTEALKLALEALEKCDSALAEELAAWDIDPPLHHVLEASNACGPAITAIREALAEQPVQQQEPVATVTSESGNLNVSMSWWHEPALPVGTKLYTSPPAQRTWVGLTDEEIDVAWNNCEAPYGFAEDIEAKLKEKNT